jgi:hypothetical protein
VVLHEVQLVHACAKPGDGSHDGHRTDRAECQQCRSGPLPSHGVGGEQDRKYDDRKQFGGDSCTESQATWQTAAQGEADQAEHHQQGWERVESPEQDGRRQHQQAVTSDRPPGGSRRPAAPDQRHEAGGRRKHEHDVLGHQKPGVADALTADRLDHQSWQQQGHDGKRRILEGKVAVRHLATDDLSRYVVEVAAVYAREPPPGVDEVDQECAELENQDQDEHCLGADDDEVSRAHGVDVPGHLARARTSHRRRVTRLRISTAYSRTSGHSARLLVR